jgi:hypothetical protein
MPVHDWTRVSAGTFHDFHCGWGVELRSALNDGILPRNYYAMAEQVAGEIGPDVVVTLQSNGNGACDADEGGGGTAVALAPPAIQPTASVEPDLYARKRRTVVIRHTSDDHIVALIEILSPGNKASVNPLRKFIAKAVNALERNIHLLLVDLFPPGPRDPEGVHAELWDALGGEPYSLPTDKRLTQVAYSAGVAINAYVVPLAVGETLADMPLFLTPEGCVQVPLEKTYQQAWRGLPWKWKDILEGGTNRP